MPVRQCRGQIHTNQKNMHRFSLKKIYWIIIVSIHIDVIGPLIKNIEVKFPPSANYSTLHNAQLCKETLNDWSFVRNQNIRGAAEILKSTSGWIRNSCTVYDPFFFFSRYVKESEIKTEIAVSDQISYLCQKLMLQRVQAQQVEKYFWSTETDTLTVWHVRSRVCRSERKRVCIDHI